MQACPHVCPGNIHDCVCTQRLTFGALINMAACAYGDTGRHRCRCTRVKAHKGTDVHIPAGIPTVTCTDMLGPPYTQETWVGVYMSAYVRTHGHTWLPVHRHAQAFRAYLDMASQCTHNWDQECTHVCTHMHPCACACSRCYTPVWSMCPCPPIPLPLCLLLTWECTPVCVPSMPSIPRETAANAHGHECV